ncbi:helix-turn-helix domain-containing protein [Halopseudomonas nanhaiensis]|uniref:helix-turn-helix transcriptional regulator n=1 Tax=Halopseudomonas nanhaiensis TaxID=2830842 RepID=UPI001CBDB61D|nr:AraC family transcriptional regulator [Halopseudomonas nanhaiensis]UAW99426.1 helix-turn-helix domain-containing protein [Halopseudomonas nanhaiensis]
MPIEGRKIAPVNRVRERAFWVPVMNQALRQYGRTLEASSLAHNLVQVSQAQSGFLDQASCSLIWSEAARLADDPFFGLRINRVFRPTPLNAIGLTTLASPDLATALKHLTRFFPIVSTQVKLELRIEDEFAFLHLHPLGEPHLHHMEAVMGYLGRLFEQLDHDNIELVLDAQLQRGGSELEECARLLGARTLTSGDEYRFTLPYTALGEPLATADSFLLPRFVEAMEDLLSNLPSNDLIDQVKRRIQNLLGSGDVSVERVAAPLNISPRHLRRKLSQEGTSYEQLVDEVRKEAAIRMISHGELSLTSIAYELGFLDPSSFTRAFRRWTDMSPTAFRRQIVSLV